jgi:hypothetical protein
MYLTAFARPWQKLESIVDSIEFTYSKVKDIAQFHAAINTSTNLSLNRENLATSRNLVSLGEGTLAVIKQLSEQVEALSVKMSKENDIHEVAALLHQRVEEKLDNPSLDDKDNLLALSEGMCIHPNLTVLVFFLTAFLPQRPVMNPTLNSFYKKSSLSYATLIKPTINAEKS